MRSRILMTTEDLMYEQQQELEHEYDDTCDDCDDAHVEALWTANKSFRGWQIRCTGCNALIAELDGE